MSHLSKPEKACFSFRTYCFRKKNGIDYADMAELADALDLGSSSSECRFDSCYPHDKSLMTTDIAVIRLF